MPFLIEGVIHYRSRIDEKSSNGYDNVFFFENGLIGESGFDEIKCSDLNTIIGYRTKAGDTKILSSDEVRAHYSFSDFRQGLSSSPFIGPNIGVWFDEESQTLFLFRDVFGSIPLFYIHVPNAFFAFSTNINGLLRRFNLADFSHINTYKIVSYISDNYVDSDRDASSTFFGQIKSALPGHILTVGSRMAASEVAIRFNPDKWAFLKTTEDFGDAIRDQFLKSIRIATRDQTKVIGSDLSGGLDSSSICSSFRHLYPDRPLHTFHIRANNQESDESGYAELVAKDVDSVHHLMYRSEDDIKNLKLSIDLYGQPEAQFLSPATHWHFLSQIKGYGCDILLNGLGGDSIIGYGDEVLGQSFDEKNWPLFKHLTRLSTSHIRLSRQFSTWDTFSFEKRYHLILQNYLYRRFTAFRNLPIRELFAMYKEVSRELGISYYYFARRASKTLFLRAVKRRAENVASIARDDFATSVKPSHGEINFPVSLRNGLPSEYQDSFDDVFHPHIIRSREQHFMLDNHFGLRTCSPLMNKDLFELSMAVPNIIKYGDGIGRAHFREAMKGILIEEVRRRNTKSTVSSLDGEKMTLRLFTQGQDYLSDGRDVWNYVDKRKFNQLVKILLNDRIPYAQKSITYFYITRTISLSVWLDSLKN
ncbi:asparagine synthase-related protein [Dyadobacter bucti]|uniref:asparagine synthase-related protein n=1 Tax=Dyadobacter bucti TaxID=2572203 RepID=UPI00110867F5|nr:asparagine synthetase B family protein [Dyadobacter bucti]